MKKKWLLILILIIICVILLSIILYKKFGIDILVKLNYETSIPVPDKTIYNYSEVGRDGNNYRVIEYNNSKIKRIKWEKLEDSSLMNGIDHFFDRNKLPEKYKPIINEETYYYKKTFENSPKKDYLLMIYNPKNKLVYIYEYHI